MATNIQHTDCLHWLKTELHKKYLNLQCQENRKARKVQFSYMYYIPLQITKIIRLMFLEWNVKQRFL
jgi:hypothetical protein